MFNESSGVNTLLARKLETPMETKQPIWELVANLGDVNPIDYGGYFVYRDTTGVYPEEAELLLVDESADGESDTWTVYRFILDRLKQVKTGEAIYLVPIRFDDSWPHAVSQYDEWFHEDLARVASYTGQTLQELRAAFCSENATDRASAYQAIGDYHGFDNLDSYPLTFKTRAEVEARYKVKNNASY
jgi:hypothetical protein